MHNRSIGALSFFLVCAASSSVLARDIDVTPATLGAALVGLAPGDRVLLASGTYDHFTLSGVVGTAAMPIAVEAAAGATPIITADSGPCCNTIQIDGDVSYVVIRGLTIDGRGIDGAFGIDARGANVHHVTVENCIFIGHDASQQTVAISTKTPTSGWVIRGNVIMGAGTGMYLGNSDGSDAFVGGLIEGNFFYDTLGYNVQIKWQLPHPPVPGAAEAPTSTIIRHNVFVKTDRASPDGDRPNLLVGGFPDTGADSTGDYQIYGNVFAHNPRDSLLQASGRVSIHDNLFFDAPVAAIRLVDHDLPLRRAWVYDNTIFVTGTGISFGNAAPDGSIVVGNVVLAGTPIAGMSGDTHDNVTGTPGDGATTFAMPGTALGSVDFYPLPGRASGPALDLAAFATDVDHDLDFNCLARGASMFRGAYAGEGTNPGWRVVLAPKPIGAACGTMVPLTDAGLSSDAGPLLDAGGRSDVGSADAGNAPPSASGCGCRVAVVHASPVWVLASSLVALVLWRRRRARALSRPRQTREGSRAFRSARQSE